jgi:phosphatidylserine/phosphatidylglycerophosphate/cardiolipin synthase-like enzyme/uncharacterized membrane protein YdjX (TVP38/TMEM64 family)
VLVDGAAFFEAVDRVIRCARRSVFVIGWDFDSRVQLRRGGDGPPSRLGELLAGLVRDNPRLEVWVLGWDFSPIYLFERQPLARLRFALGMPDRVHFQLDKEHPPGASHHQKVVVVDDSVAFCGGLDLCDVRWDTPAHRAGDPDRTDLRGRIYRPHHDVQMAVDGEAAAALGELARERWRRATGEELPRCDPCGGWPADLPADLRDVDVAITRTLPRLGERPPVREVEQLWLDSIAAARRSIYVENAYFTSRTIADALIRRLREPTGPEVVLVLPQVSSGWIEDITMGVLRERELDRVFAADHYDRLRVVAPWLPAREPGGAPVSLNLHSKVCIVDDELLRIGSSNATNRSMGLDTECDLVVEANDRDDVREAIAGVRDRLLAEHLGVEPARVRERVEATGSLRDTIAQLSGGERTLAAYQRTQPLFDEVLPDAEIVDPHRPLTMREVGRWLARGERERTKRRRWKYAGLAWWSVFAAIVVAVRLAGWIDAGDIIAAIDAARGSPALTALAVTGAFVVGGLLLVPVTLMIAGCGALFGPGLGLAYALCGAFSGAALYHRLGRSLGRDAVDDLAGPRLRAALRKVARRGLLAVAAVRLLPVAPHVVVGLAAGAARVSFRDYMLGSILAMIPGGVVLVLLGHELTAGGPSRWRALAVIAALIAVGLVCAWTLRRWIARNGAAELDPEAGDAG